ncbi:RibD family protein [Halomonas sp. CUBES01]|uniref:RibD family protein n=1 Tax=Halomonas sp. CUBES01 TaxID=2897340 RepID=UPI001E623279|nr:RibD family protein [Halomonas sp. CUBES01]MEC4768030.1 RibD family protein [Halomonas sp. CUBES01]
MPDSKERTNIIQDDVWRRLLAGHASDGERLVEDAGEPVRCLAPLATTPGWVIAQLGQSLDGRIATQSGHSHYINGRESLVHLHRLRALADAVVIGAGTADADDPQLTVRHVSGRHPTRVVLDPRGRVPMDRKLFQDAAAPTLHVVGPDTARAAATGSVECCVLPLDHHGRFVPSDVIALLQARQLLRILVEGGGITVSQFIEAGVVDRLHLLVAPLLIGSGRPGLQMTPIETLDSALRPALRTFRCGDDTLFDVVLRPAAFRG